MRLRVFRQSDPGTILLDRVSKTGISSGRARCLLPAVWLTPNDVRWKKRKRLGEKLVRKKKGII